MGLPPWLAASVPARHRSPTRNLGGQIGLQAADDDALFELAVVKELFQLVCHALLTGRGYGDSRLVGT